MNCEIIADSKLGEEDRDIPLSLHLNGIESF